MGAELSSEGGATAPQSPAIDAARALQVSFDVFALACCRRSPDAFVPAGVLESAFRAYLRGSGLHQRDGFDILSHGPIVPTALGGSVFLEQPPHTLGHDGIYVGIALERWPTSGVTMGDRFKSFRYSRRNLFWDTPA